MYIKEFFHSFQKGGRAVSENLYFAIFKANCDAHIPCLIKSSPTVLVFLQKILILYADINLKISIFYRCEAQNPKAACCLECDERFTTLAALIDHIHSRNGGIKRNCTLCLSVFSREDALNFQIA